MLGLYLDLNPTASAPGGRERPPTRRCSTTPTGASRRTRPTTTGASRCAPTSSARPPSSTATGPNAAAASRSSARPAFGLFEAYTLPRAPATRVVVDDSPYVTPLAAAAHTRDWLIVLVDSRHARFLHGNTDRIQEFERIEDSIAGQHERSGPSDHQR